MFHMLGTPEFQAPSRLLLPGGSGVTLKTTCPIKLLSNRQPGVIEGALGSHTSTKHTVGVGSAIYLII